MIFKLAIVLSLFGFQAISFAEETNTINTQTSAAAPQTQPPVWKATFDSYFYNFEGERGNKHKEAYYEFGDTTLKMQLMSLQYQLNPSWTLMMMAQYYDNFVVTKMFGTDYKDSSRGVADTIVEGINTQFLSPNLLLITDVGVSLPTGSIDEKTPYDPSGQKNYPYNMQMGSGTTDLLVGVTPLWIMPSYQVGGRLAGIFRTTGYNENGYRLGNQYKLDAWIDVPVGSTGLTPRIVGYYKHRNGIRGQDSTLRDPAGRAFIEYYYHDQINWDVSAALKYTKNFSQNVALKAEVGVPMAQDCINYDDTAIFTEYYGTVGVSGSF